MNELFSWAEKYLQETDRTVAGVFLDCLAGVIIGVILFFLVREVVEEGANSESSGLWR